MFRRTDSVINGTNSVARVRRRDDRWDDTKRNHCRCLCDAVSNCATDHVPNCHIDLAAHANARSNSDAPATTPSSGAR